MPVGAPVILSFRISPPNGFGVSAVMPAIFKRRAVRNRAVSIRAREVNGIVWRNFVELLRGRKRGRFPEGLDPAAAGDPLVRRRLRGTLLDLGEKFFARAQAFEIQIHLAKADAENVIMRIGQTGQHGVAMQINDARRTALRACARRHSIRRKRCDPV